MYKKSILKNGLRIVSHPIAQRDSIAIGIWIGVGGRYEEDRTKGVAHFLEHIVFKGSRKYKGEEIKRRIEGVGGALNAFTSEEQTCFYAKIPARHLDQTFDVLADMVLHPTIAATDVGKERTVIVEEIKMYHDLPQYFVLELLDGLLWPDHPLGKSLAGTAETVTGISAKDLKAFHQKHYVPANIVVAACGNINHERIVRLARAKLGGLPESAKNTYLPVNRTQNKPSVRYYKKNIEQMHLALGFPGYDEQHKDRYALSLLSVLLGGNMSSRLFVEVREKRGLAYSISCAYKTLHDTGLFLIRAGVDNQKIVEAIQLILKELNKIRRDGVGQNEFKRARDYITGQLLLSLEDTMDHMLWIGEGIITKNKVKTVRSVMNKFAQISPRDIQRVAKEILHCNHMNLAVVGPVSDRQTKDLNRLLGV